MAQRSLGDFFSQSVINNVNETEPTELKSSFLKI